MKIGLVGLPKSGKTSLFNLLTGQSVATSSFGTARGEMHTDTDAREQAILLKVKPGLEGETPIRALDLREDEARALRGFTFLSQKPILHCLNLAEEASRAGTRIGWVSAVIEAEVAQLAGDEQAAFLADLGLAEPAIKRVLRDCYTLLGLISFFTVGEDEVRAWSVPHGTRAHDAAGVIHTDIARGFIRAEVVGYEELVAAEGSMATVRERGQFRLEGKEYVVEDGQVCHFRFNVAK